ncbi:type I polyketide synthase [Gloeobacter kilaueensis]|uniref:Beta-ketoacyl synthase n=1 Tax=Gloeobacter kilaueensis (strain ATCC BAA-2537 / CCAP 1431/1 / ULC 316 / JS1) TaxID=1183438 RepID=U5QQD8_GLOK1|nr:type I polyketide synthase [Gloeobacter kilaueensis]AGY59895.1 beta-ketoacyl synthase [Gloeobacter kilaueensis JS1]
MPTKNSATPMNFTCLSISPIQNLYPGIAIATVRGGGIGILDREFCPVDELPVARTALEQLCQAARAVAGSCGLRLRASQVATSYPLLEPLAGQPHWLILCGWDTQTLAQALASLPEGAERRVLVEVTDLDQAELIVQAQLPVDGLVVRGHECGGWVGEDSAFVLAQKLLRLEGTTSIYVQGGIGIHTAGACRVAGVAGVILDDQLWLMPESPLSAEQQSYLNELNGQEAIPIGERLDAPLRVLARPGFAVIARLQALAEQIDLIEDRTEALRQWQQQADALIGWGEAGVTAWPIGQAMGLAAVFRERYRTTGRLVQAILKESARHIELAQQCQPLKPGSALAASHRTEYPIVQGPMTRVSDTSEFADAVAGGGGLPLLALALMRGEQVRSLLVKTQALMQGRSWGVGILGFASHALREEQMKAVREVKPPFALIAGGRPDQAAQLEEIGIATYIHVPVPRLLKMFLEQGAHRFVFEGRECGGHVGPLSSFLLWESMVDTLLAEVPAQRAASMHILFAGGIHDATSAAMVATLAAPLTERGMKVGVLMGSAYLFTEEAVSCGAIVRQFQEQAIACRRTINLETGPGHASRCAVTPFAYEFYQTRRRMVAAGHSPEEVKNTLEDLTLGRLRTASKGMVRGPEGIKAVDEPTQIKDGMYMIGQVATMRDRVCSVRELHAGVSEGSAARLVEQSAAIEDQEAAPTPSDIAVIGIGTLLPSALDAESYWETIIKQVSTIAEIPAERWDWRLYFDSDRNKRDKIYSRWGSFLEDVPFDPVRFGIPPRSLRSIEPMQLLALEAVRQAIADAGYEGSDFDREHTSVIFGIGGSVGDLGQQYAARSEIPRIVGQTDPEVFDRLPEWTEESFPGLLANVVAGRVANRFNLGGSNFTVDAACASSLAAIHLAVRELESGNSSLAIAGGVDTSQGPFPYFCFSKTQALTPRGTPRPFDKSADGIVIGEGLAMVVLKRLADAERDGDRIYAVIKATAGSSDGKALGMTAPLPAGQKRAVRRAYQKAGFSPRTLSLYEAHGTGTALGDSSELTTLTETLAAEKAAPKSCAIGSVKLLIGHTKSTAGVAALIKASLALHWRVLPGHPIPDPLDPIVDPDSPVYLLSQPRPWFAGAAHPRRAGVSAFGFGGTNFHAILEEYRGSVRETAPGAARWPQELFVWQAASKDALIKDLRTLRKAAVAGTRHSLRDLAYTCARQAMNRQGQAVRLGIVAASHSELADALDQAIAALEAPQVPVLPENIRIGIGPAIQPAEIAFVFPGQGSQYPDMAREAVLYFEELRRAIEQADGLLAQHLPLPLSHYIYPPAAHSEADEAQQRRDLTRTQVAQPALGALEAGYLDLAHRLGLKAAMVCGHSFSEYTALHAAGVLSRTDFLRLSQRRGQVMAEASRGGDGAMAAIKAERAQLEALLAKLDPTGSVIVANHNAPLQSVLSGDRETLARVVQQFNDQGIDATLLNVAGAFHSPRIAAAEAPMRAAIEEAALQPPVLPVYSNTTARPYPSAPEAIAQQITGHLLHSVEFVEQIRTMYADGARLFVELGPKMVLTRLIGQILEGQAHTALALDGQGGGLRGLLTAFAGLAACGVPLRWTALFDGREAVALSTGQLTAPAPALSATAWLVNGGVARPAREPVAYTGNKPPLTLETFNQTRPALPAPVAASPPVPTPIAVPKPAVAGNGNGNGNGKHPTAPASNGHKPTLHPPTVSPVPSSRPPVQPQVMPVQSHTIQQPASPMSNDLALQAYVAHQQTMRQFLATEEQVMRHFLQFAAGRPLSAPLPQSAAPPLIAPPVAVPAAALPAPAAPAPAMQPLPAPVVQPAPVTIAPPVLPVAAAPPPPPPPPPAIKAAPVPAPATAMGREQVTRTILELVSERTGYPVEVLGLDQDVEAELGIDSIKRVEIMGALQKALPAEWTAQVQSKMETLTRAKTLNHLIDQVLTLASSTATEEGQGPKKSWSAVEAAPRFVMEAQVQPLLRSERTALEGLFLLTEDSLGVASHLASALQAAGARTVTVPAALLASPEPLNAHLEQLRTSHGPVTGIVHLAPLDRLALPGDLSGWRNCTQIQAKSFFQILKACSADLTAAGAKAHVLAASALGGYLGRKDTVGPGLAAGGGVFGIVKTVAQEWSDAHAKALDFDGSLDARQMSECLLAEIFAADSRQEVGYPAGQRTVFQAVPAPLAAGGTPRLRPDSDWVTLVIGGARGITAEIAADLAETGMTLIVAARSPVPTPESAETEGIENLGTLRKLFLARLQAAGKKPTPALIEQQVQNLLKERAIARNLARFEKLGARVGYYSVRDEQQLASLIEEIYGRYGRLDAVVNGAGIIEDKLIADKSFESFSRVFDTKVDIAFTLARTLRPETLKLLVFFSSVAGRFGNRGQVDYAAANETMNRLAWQMDHQWPQTRVISLNWGPWESGMASEAVKEQFRKRNVIPIPLESGRKAFIEELFFGPKGAVEIVHGEGPWETAELTRGNFKPEAAVQVSSGPPVRPFALIRSPFVLQPNSTVTLDHTFTTASDPYLIDHSMDGNPVLPATVALEWLAEFVQDAWPDLVVTEVRDLRVLRGVVLNAPQGRRVTLSARASVHADADALEVSAEVFDPDKKAPFYRALVVMRPRLEEEPTDLPEPLRTTGSVLDAATAYRDHTFHGPQFQLLSAIERLDEHGIDAVVQPSRPAQFLATGESLPDWLFDPGLLDTLPQLALFWARINQGSFALPSRLGRVIRYGSGPLAGPLRIAFRVTSANEHQLSYDAHIIDRDGHVRLVLIHGESNSSRALNRLARVP